MTRHRERLIRWRERVRERPATNTTYRGLVGISGFGVLAVGVVAIPYPGPGWAIVFLGLGILATEFLWAQRVLAFAKGRYETAMTWFRGQGRGVQAAGIALTTAVVIATLWLLGALSLSASVAGVDWPVLKSPIGLGS